MNLHTMIMNLACNELHAGSPEKEVQRAYGEGHKCARHDAAELASMADAEIERLQMAWECTRSQRDELLAHIAGKAPLPQWAADWLKA